MWLKYNHSKVSKQASKQIIKACRWEPKKERMYGIKTRVIPLTLWSSIDSIHWSLCSGSSALRYQRLSFTLMSKRHSSNSWGCTEEWTCIRVLLDRAYYHKQYLQGITNENMSNGFSHKKHLNWTPVPNGCKCNFSYLPQSWSFSMSLPDPEWASLFIFPPFSPHPRWPKCGQSNPSPFLPRSELND